MLGFFFFNLLWKFFNTFTERDCPTIWTGLLRLEWNFQSIYYLLCLLIYSVCFWLMIKKRAESKTLLYLKACLKRTSYSLMYSVIETRPFQINLGCKESFWLITFNMTAKTFRSKFPTIDVCNHYYVKLLLWLISYTFQCAISQTRFYLCVTML